MPELPEVHTTVQGIATRAVGAQIIDVWTDYDSPVYANKLHIKNRIFFNKFKTLITGASIVGASRRGKNILILLSNEKTILIHMKMTGHIMYGEYIYQKSVGRKKGQVAKKEPISPTPEAWRAKDQSLQNPLNDPFNRFIHLVFTLEQNVSKKASTSSTKHLVLSDMRKFAKVTLLETKKLDHSDDLKDLGPEPLDEKFTTFILTKQISRRPNTPIKQVLMDQTLISGIGNIYSDEILWQSNIHPLSKPKSIPEKNLKLLFKAVKYILSRGIDFGGDSMSDYRNIDGLPGNFQKKHEAYRRTGEKCRKIGCTGNIQRMIIGGRSGHFCSQHQILF